MKWPTQTEKRLCKQEGGDGLIHNNEGDTEDQKA